jgi:hypothetical protein
MNSGLRSPVVAKCLRNHVTTVPLFAERVPMVRRIESGTDGIYARA